jgi:hypothetical protein
MDKERHMQEAEADPALSAEQLAKILPGGWELIGWTIDYTDGKPSRQPFGESPKGLLVYTHDGHMAACIERRERVGSGLNGDNDRTHSKDFFAYSGHYKLESGAVIHLVSVASELKMAGTEQRREVLLQQHQLTLCANNRERCRSDRITWRRAQ